MMYCDLEAALKAISLAYPGAWLKLRNKKPRLAILVRYPGQKRGKTVWEALY